jgi:2-phospho-L-lactate guanylyltransferase
VGQGAEVTVAVLVPVKAFARAKARLTPVLDQRARTRLARELADRVVLAAGSLPVSVVCDDEEVADWARGAGATVHWCPGRGLNGAVTDGYERLGVEGVDRIVVSHADLPLILDFDEVLETAGAALVPDRHEDGTNVMALPARTGFRFGYGPGSFDRHRAEADRVGLDVTVVRSSRLRWDLDVPDDLTMPDDVQAEPLRSMTQ